MNAREFFLGRDDFKSVDAIVKLVSRNQEFDPRHENVSEVESLLIFQTSKQQTWLIATNWRLYCVLDDPNRGFTRVLWVLPAKKLIQGGKIVAEISTKNWKEKTGLLNIADRRNWLFSKKLFSDESIEVRISGMLKRQMGRYR